MRAGEGAFQPKPPAKLRANAKRLRRDSTDAEKKLWSILRNRQLAGVKFRRQFPVANYIVDFAAPECKLVIELDGGQHNESVHQLRDTQRDVALAALGWRVLRFWNHEVLQNLEGVATVITNTLTLVTRKRVG